ncbi:MAG: pre-peptidase C-terminal domain-containing protein [Xenococcaceae cyanobacterium MO_167.B27]|nr:pre-peptidase C-terminal domain-containing protein [Xenococcaceae cyanobacterium MO_167.B27]
MLKENQPKETEGDKRVLDLLTGELSIENGSFETGTFVDWERIGDTSIQTAEFGTNPSDGIFQALLTNGFSDSGSSVVDSDIEEFLNLTPGVLDSLGNGDVTEGSAIKQTFTANAGDILTFDWNFLTNEATPEDTFNDFAFFSITPFTLELADTTSPLFTDTLVRDFSEETGYQTTSIAISESGTYTLSFGIADVGDDSVDSALLVDNIQIGFDDEIEPNDTIFEATPTGLFGEGEFIIWSEIFPENDVDLFEVFLDAGDQLIADIDAEFLGSGLDSVLSVFDSTGFLVAQNDDDFGSLDSFIDFTAGFSDTYYVGVSSFDNFDYDPFVEGSGIGDSFGFYDLFITVT